MQTLSGSAETQEVTVIGVLRKSGIISGETGDIFLLKHPSFTGI
jgi:hypothetical protein